MNLHLSPFKAYLRLRHSHGYGIHSPFAYRLVTMAIHPGRYGYYGYAEIERTPEREGHPGRRDRRVARLLLRFLVASAAKRLVTSDPRRELWRSVARGAGIPFISFQPGRLPALQRGDMLLVSDSKIPSRILAEAIGRGCGVFALRPSPETSDALARPAGGGVLFAGTRIAIRIPNDDASFVRYTVRL